MFGRKPKFVKPPPPPEPSEPEVDEEQETRPQEPVGPEPVSKLFPGGHLRVHYVRNGSGTKRMIVPVEDLPKHVERWLREKADLEP